MSERSERGASPEEARGRRRRQGRGRAVRSPRAALVALALLLGCRPPSTTTVHYPHATIELLNPERGLVTDVDLVAERDLAWVRAAGFTLGYARVRLDAYRYDALPAELLDALRAGFGAARAAGIKVIVRFVYNDDEHGADAPRDRILEHLRQLGPVLGANADVLAVLDGGFIGAWGEWHSSTHGLDNPADRATILAAMLAAVPASRSVLIRTPLYKEQLLGGPLTTEDAHDGSRAARIGHHNSCFLASETDLGTYPDPIEQWKDFVAEEGRFTPVGGETCRLHPPRTDCATATAELRRLHWSFLNSLYHRDVLATWKVQGCHDEIARDLGYRLELRSVSFSEKGVAGGVIDVTIRLENTGYAAIFNARPVYLMLDDTPYLLAEDPRRWEPGQTITIHAQVPIPSDAAPGAHRLGLWLPDAHPRLRAPGLGALYAVRIANAAWTAPVNVLTEALVVAPSGG